MRTFIVMWFVDDHVGKCILRETIVDIITLKKGARITKHGRMISFI